MNKAQLKRALTFALKTIKELESIIEQLESIIEQAEDIKTPADIEREEAIDGASKIIEMAHGSAGGAYKKYCGTLYDAGYHNGPKQGEMVSVNAVSMHLYNNLRTHIRLDDACKDWIEKHYTITPKVKT